MFETRHKIPAKPKLLDQVKLKLQSERYSKKTIEAYTKWVREFILFDKEVLPSYRSNIILLDKNDYDLCSRCKYGRRS